MNSLSRSCVCIAVFFTNAIFVSGFAWCEATKIGDVAEVSTSGVPEVKAEAKSQKPSSSEGIELVNKHLRELMPVLEHLRAHSSAQYEKAVRDLDRSAKSLEAIKRRDGVLYEISLREWKARCQIDLLKARLQVQKTPQNENQMLERLKLLREIELERLSREIVVLEDRNRLYEDRMQLSRQLIERGEMRKQQLLEQQHRLMEEPIGRDSAVYLKAIHAEKKDTSRAARPTQSSSKKGNP